MSVLRLPEGMNSVWDNEAFDNEESEDSSTIMKSSWSPSKGFLGKNSSESINYFSDKENQGLLENSSLSVAVKSPMPFKALSPNAVLEKSKILANKTVSELGFAENSNCNWDEKKIDREMEGIEREINRLSLRLEALRIEKLERTVNVAENRRTDVKIASENKTIEEVLPVSARTKMPTRRLSLCPGDVSASKKRSSLGPMEYLKSGQVGKKERMVTPIQAPQSRRKSCFWKLEDIGEEMVSRERGKKSLSLSPRSRKSTLRNQSSRQVATTIASKKTMKKEDGLVNSIQPKKLFKDGEKSVATTTKAPRPGRVVASRYNQNTSQASSAVRKRSLPENDTDGSKQCDKKRSVLVGKSRAETKNLATEIRVKKRWEIPNELVVHRSSETETENSPKGVVIVPDLLPRIKTSRRITETPRDSGQAKRVVDLIGKKTYFSIDEEEDETSVCQALSFAEDEDVEF